MRKISTPQILLIMFFVFIGVLVLIFSVSTQSGSLITGTATLLAHTSTYVVLPPTYSPLVNEAQKTDLYSKPVGTATPYPITETIDLAPEIPQEDKARAIIEQSGGTFYSIWFRFDKLPELRKKDDKLVFIEPPASLFGNHRP